MSTDCIFCRIIAGSIPATRLGESELGIAIRDVTPQAPFHALVMPRAHVQSLAQADAATAGDLMVLAARVAREAGLEADGYRAVVNTGRDGGQSVPHLHIHVLGGRGLTWPPG